jgi:exopolyphosphatase/guanosine-5'-triphosphate,3'-diphosphate pyrophosphatase
VANLLKSLLRGASSAAPSADDSFAPLDAQGRLPLVRPVAVIDVGSNSVRLVVYEGLIRSPTPVFNEKILCGLGRELASRRRLPTDAIKKAIAALKRFRALCDIMQVEQVFAVATAAVREARNGADFIRQAEAACGTPIEVLSGKREAWLSALGVVSGVREADGVVGDLGGGSLELVDVEGEKIGGGATLPLGGLALADAAKDRIEKAEKIAKRALSGEPTLKALRGRTFYMVGGTWRAMARLHMWQTGYPLHVTHGYTIPAREANEFARLVHRVDPDTLSRIDVVSEARRPLLPFGAVVLEQIVRIGQPRQLVVSALGLREGLLHDMLDVHERRKDPLLSAAADLNLLRSRSPRHGEELVDWTDRFMASTGIEERPEERRLRHAACLLADIGWRAHPDYRGEQSLNIIAHATFVGIDHPGRAFLALSVFFRHAGLDLDADELSPRMRELATTRLLDRARVLGAAMRVAYIVSASMPGVLPKTPMLVQRGRLILRLERGFAALAGDRLRTRVRQLGKLIGRDSAIITK